MFGEIRFRSHNVLKHFIEDTGSLSVTVRNDLSLVGDPDVFALIWLKNHLPFSFPFLGASGRLTGWTSQDQDSLLVKRGISP